MDVTMRFGLMFLSLVIAAPALAGECQFDNRAELLAMPPDAFNQGPGEGWDALVERAGCQLELADLFAAYRQQPNATGRADLTWHEARLRASAGQRDPASALMRLTYRPRDADPEGWNHYVDATIAFLDDDLPALKRARARLAKLPMPAGNARERGDDKRPAWPPRLQIVDSLIRCMYQPYALASESCPEA
ncbi:TPA: hypothetical protein ACKPZV_003235 [Stenotrophomonas maltophilia]